MLDAFTLGLAAFALTWFFSFWYRTERLRERMGIFFMYDGDEPTERLDCDGLGAWVNCPQCCALLCWAALGTVYLASRLNAGTRLLLDGGAWRVFLPYASEAVLSCLGGLGLALLLVRWYECARPKARWWQ